MFLSLSLLNLQDTDQQAYLYLLTLLNGLGEVLDGRVFLQFPERDDSLLVANEEQVAVGRAERETAN